MIDILDSETRKPSDDNKEVVSTINALLKNMQTTVWYAKDGEPTNELGKNGDFYLDNEGNYYNRVSDEWKRIGNLKGKDGADGRNPLTINQIAPNNPHKGDLWYHKNLFAYNGTDWVEIKGRDGKDGIGINGKSVNLRIHNNSVQWQREGESWTDLVRLNALQGPKGEPGKDGEDGEDGREVELRATETHLQWRYKGERKWKDLIDLTKLKSSTVNWMGGGVNGLQGVRAGTNITITGDPLNPIISASGGGGGGAVDSVFGRTGVIEAEAGDYDDLKISVDDTDIQALTDGSVSGDNVHAIFLSLITSFSGTITTIFGTIANIETDVSDLQSDVSDIQSDITDINTSLSGKVNSRVITSSSGNFTAGSVANTDYVYIITGNHTPTMPTAVDNTNRYTVLADSLADGLASIWTSSNGNSASAASSTGGEGVLDTGANATGYVQLTSTVVQYLPGQSAWLNSAVRFSDTGSAGNVRRIGAFTVDGSRVPQEGFYFEVNSSGLSAVVVKGGTPTSVAAASFSRVADAPFTLDTNYHSFEIRFTANSAQFYIDNVVRHIHTGTNSAITTTLDFPITLQSINSSGASSRAMYVRNIGMGRFGQRPTETGFVGSPPRFASIAASTSGNNTIAAAVTGKRLRVLSAHLSASAAVNFKFQSGAGGTDLTGLTYATTNSGIVLPYNPSGHFETAVSTLLNLNLSAAVAVGGSITYIEV